MSLHNRLHSWSNWENVIAFLHQQVSQQFSRIVECSKRTQELLNESVINFLQFFHSEVVFSLNFLLSWLHFDELLEIEFLLLLLSLLYEQDLLQIWSFEFTTIVCCPFPQAHIMVLKVILNFKGNDLTIDNLWRIQYLLAELVFDANFNL